jgi:GntR family transcriptional regulator
MTQSSKSGSLRAHLVHQIRGGLRPHDRLPTERELADAFGASRMTVRHVLDRLAAEGLVYRVQGSGTFVAETRITKAAELTSFSDDMRGRGLRPGSETIHTSTGPAGAVAGYRLGLSPADEIVRIRRVRTADGVPMCLEDVILPAELTPGLLARQLDGSLYEMLEQDYRVVIERADQTVRATVLDPPDAELLHVPPLSPALAVERLGYTARGRAVEYATSLYRSDRYAYQMTLHRGGPGPG